ncbi:DUF72 domain-containing protein [Salinimonas sediminis]|uniref:DUF72 domain-containing protein n=1 Tax=Salinimonas sediminis TaxID=2303538 RepID=A0A346NK89_9ALTE|nr:DUF72 domain-containing protein [Salinimonas sediminis]AXR05946.1 DUF72 domain-containing protein [Salinimonas sediminis]
MANTLLAATDLPALAPIHIGLPVWQHSSWASRWFCEPAARQQNLTYYARQLSSIEGNTTFYSLPEPATVCGWRDKVPDHFRFTFKLHQAISHTAIPGADLPLLDRQIALFSLLEHKLGAVLLQLPAQFDPSQLSQLGRLLDYLNDRWPIAVEVRHPAFFAKGREEQQLNRLLLEAGANRMIMDTRALFSGPSDSPLTGEVRLKKPRVPVNVIATAEHPVVRFVGSNDEQTNRSKLQPWVHKCHQWRQQGKTPYLFLHRPDNKDAPWLAQLFVQLYNQAYPDSALPEPVKPGSTQERLF